MKHPMLSLVVQRSVIKGIITEFESVVWLEFHAQLKTKTKVFRSCLTSFGAPPNTHACPVCLGMPGVLPVLNKKVVDYTLRMAVATNYTIAQLSRFARKNYFIRIFRKATRPTNTNCSSLNISILILK